jgi:hypothetical protein
MVSFSIFRLDEISSVTTRRIIYTGWDCWERKRAKSHSALRSFLRRNLRALENTEFIEAINTVESKDDKDGRALRLYCVKAGRTKKRGSPVEEVRLLTRKRATSPKS